MPERSPAVERLLAKEVAPYGSMESGEMAMAGVVHPDDPVLRYLGDFKDERAYRAMVNAEPGISSALETRYGSVISAGYSIEPGDGGGSQAEDLAEWTRSLFKSGLRNVDQVQRNILEGVGFGWQPLNLIWGEWRAKGRSWYVPIRAKRKPHQDYRFSFPGHHLVHYWPHGGNAVVFPHRQRGGVDWFRWLTPSYGEAASPYGDALLKYVWSIYTVKGSFFRQWAAGTARSMGILHAKAVDGMGAFQGGGDVPKFNFDEIRDQLLEVLEFLAANQVLVSMPNHTLEWLENVKYAEGWKHPLQYIDQWIQIVIAGEGLTAAMGMSNAAGSRSAGEVTERKTQRRSTADARYLEAGMSDLIQRAIEWNFGEVDDDVRPRFVSKLGKKPDVEALNAYLTSGGRASEGRLADLYGIPAPPGVGLDDVLGETRPASKNAPMPFGAPLGGEQTMEDQGGEVADGEAGKGDQADNADQEKKRSASLAEFLREERVMGDRLAAASSDAERYVAEISARLAEPWAEALAP